MFHILANLHDSIAVYLDDIVIHSATWEEHLQHATTIWQ